MEGLGPRPPRRTQSRPVQGRPDDLRNPGDIQSRVPTRPLPFVPCFPRSDPTRLRRGRHRGPGRFRPPPGPVISGPPRPRPPPDPTGKGRGQVLRPSSPTLDPGKRGKGESFRDGPCLRGSVLVPRSMSGPWASPLRPDPLPVHLGALGRDGRGTRRWVGTDRGRREDLRRPVVRPGGHPFSEGNRTGTWNRTDRPP